MDYKGKTLKKETAIYLNIAIIDTNDAGVKSPTTELENLIFTVNTDNPPFCEL